MKKIITTEMKPNAVCVDLYFVSEDSDNAQTPICYVFPFDAVNPRTALQIATLLVQDPTVPSDHETKTCS